MGSRLSSLALSITPYVLFGAFIQYCRKSKDIDFNDELEITPLQRKALMVHLAYFITCPLLIEVFPDAPGLDILVGPLPDPSNVLHMLQCLAAENFFVTSTALGFILSQESSVPRWGLMPVFAQLAWNLKNHLSWWFLGKTFAPEGPFPFAVADMIIIWPIVYIYGSHFFNAKKKSEKKE